jgi:hypothetical protein
MRNIAIIMGISVIALASSHEREARILAPSLTSAKIETPIYFGAIQTRGGWPVYFDNEREPEMAFWSCFESLMYKSDEVVRPFLCDYMQQRI